MRKLCHENLTLSGGGKTAESRPASNRSARDDDKGVKAPSETNKGVERLFLASTGSVISNCAKACAALVIELGTKGE